MVSIVVPVYNAYETIKECIESILDNDYPKELTEILAIDDGSTDKTLELLEEIKDNRLKILVQDHGGPAKARNLGIHESKGDIIIFTDSDCISPKDWLKKMTERIKEDKVIGGGIEPSEGYTIWERFEQNRRDRLYGKEEKTADLLPSCNLAVKKEILNEVNGFDERFKYASWEDYDLCNRIHAKGYSIYYYPDIHILHKHSTTFKGILKKAYTHGRENILYKKIHGKSRANIIIRLIMTIIAIPALIIFRYPPKMIIIGLAYSISSLIGNTIGILRYMR